MSGYESRSAAQGVVRRTIEANTLGLPKDVSSYYIGKIYDAVIVNRGFGYGYGIEFEAERFWDAVRANLRASQPSPVVESNIEVNYLPSGAQRGLNTHSHDPEHDLLKRYTFERKTPSGWLVTGSAWTAVGASLLDPDWSGSYRIFDTKESTVYIEGGVTA